MRFYRYDRSRPDKNNETFEPEQHHRWVSIVVPDFNWLGEEGVSEFGFIMPVELIQFRIFYYKEGDVIYVNHSIEDEIQGDDVFHGIPNDKMLVDCVADHEDGVVVTFPFVLLRPMIFLSDSASFGGMQDAITNSSAEDVFEDFIEDILKLAKSHGTIANLLTRGEPKIIDVITKWDFQAHRHETYDGVEYDTDYSLLGAVVLNNLTSYDD